MTEQFDADDDLRLDVLAAELRLDRQDGLKHAEALARRLTRLFPEYVTVRRGVVAGRAGPGPLQTLTAELGGQYLVLTAEGGRLRYESTHRVHGIDLNRTTLRAAEWVDRLTQAIVDQEALAQEDGHLRNLL